MELDPAIVIIVGVFLPLVVAVINRQAWDSTITALIDFILVIAVGILVAWLTDHWNKDGVLATCAAVYGIAQAVLKGLWKPTGVTDQIEKTTG